MVDNRSTRRARVRLWVTELGAATGTLGESLPLCVGAIRDGTMALHRVRAGELDPAALADALVFAELGLGLLLDGQSGLPAGALDNRGPVLLTPQIHQATGMIAAQLEVSMADAFARLRARAFLDQRRRD